MKLMRAGTRHKLVARLQLGSMWPHLMLPNQTTATAATGPTDIARSASLSALLLLAVPLISTAAPSAPPTRPPNIVLILADDLGFSDTSPYGSEIHTPNIAALAAEGMRFTNYHTAASCAPTRGMLLTGVDSHRNGVPNIVEAIPAEQLAHENYRGVLSQNVVTLATRLKDVGYHTYMAGKWHLGHEEPDQLPDRRGFERSVVMADTGADNWEKKPYLPIYKQANWYEDGKEIDLPADFYSSKFFIDKTIEYIDSNRSDRKPFFAYIPFQAVHIPVQAPREFTEKYLGVYDQGWSDLRSKRLDAAIAQGVVSPGTQLAPVSGTQDWAALSAEKQRLLSKSMAVYAGMVDAMDHHIGRLIAHLKETGQYDDTLFVFTSDNGAEGSDPSAVPGGELLSDLFLWFMDYNTDYETLGERGSFVAIGPSFASAACSPLAYYKFFAHDGGMRVPLVVAGGGVAHPGSTTDAFAYVTDIAPTILELAGVTAATTYYDARSVEPMTGTSLTRLLSGDSATVHPKTEPIGYELAGNSALFKGDHKIVLDRRPIGDGQWHLYNIASDAGEARDLQAEMPELFQELRADYEAYARANNVLVVPDGYDQRTTVFRKGLRKRFGSTATALMVGAALLGILFVLRRKRSA